MKTSLLKIRLKTHTEFRIRQLCISGQLPCFKAGRKYLISEDKLYEVVLGESVNSNGGDVVA